MKKSNQNHKIKNLNHSWTDDSLQKSYQFLLRIKLHMLDDPQKIFLLRINLHVLDDPQKIFLLKFNLR